MPKFKKRSPEGVTFLLLAVSVLVLVIAVLISVLVLVIVLGTVAVLIIHNLLPSSLKFAVFRFIIISRLLCFIPGFKYKTGQQT